MKRLFTLLILSIFLVATANTAHAQHAEKTRYVYLWDVTGSTKAGNLYDVISNFMVGDIKSKFSRTSNENNIDIVIIPFNDDTKDIYSYKITNDGIEPEPGSPELDAITGGIDEKLINAHNDLWKSNTEAKIGSGGYTNIAAALTKAKEYICNDWNTIFILLTDGGQEYYRLDNELEIAKNKEDNIGLSKARDYLVKSIAEFDGKLKDTNDRGVSFNMLFYVITAGDNYDPSKVFRGSDYTQFINTNGSSINLHFSTIEANQPSAISIDDKKFEIYFPIKRKELLDKIGIQVTTANIEGLTINCQHKINSNGCIEVQPSNGSFAEAFKVNDVKGEEFTFEVSLSLYDFNRGTTRNFLDFGDNTNKDFVWFKSNETKLTIKVINNFNPTITVKFKNN